MDDSLRERCLLEPKRRFAAVVSMHKDVGGAGYEALGIADAVELLAGTYSLTASGEDLLLLAERPGIEEIVADFEVEAQ